MSKTKNLHELVNLLAKALRHKIGALVNPNEIYAQKYAKDADVLMKEAQKVALRENWNNYEKAEIKKKLEKKLRTELEKKDFLDNRKFDIMGEEIDKALNFLGLQN